MSEKNKPLISQPLEWRVDTRALLVEITENALREKHGILFQPINIFKNILVEVAERAIRLNDPELNILMLRLNLYEVPPKEISKAIESQRSLLKPD